MDRRLFLQRGSALAALLASGTIVACGDGDDTESSSSAGTTDGPPTDPPPTDAPPTDGAVPTTEPASEPVATEVPSPAGSITVALLGSPTDTLNPAMTSGELDFAVLFTVHDSLVLLVGDEFQLQLAESIEPNADGTEWTIVLREGPTFHDGSPVTAADVVYSLNLYGMSPNYGQFFALIDLPNMRAVDDRTVVVPMVAPRGDLVESVLGQLSVVVPDGFTDWGRNVGSGPFALESYEAGVGAVVVRNEAYWAGAPSLERVEFTSIVDAATKASALTSGDIDYATAIDATAAATLEGVDGVEIVRGELTSSSIRCFAFNRRLAPFDDPRVIEACKLAVDRQQLVDVVAFGNATIGNDMPSLGFAGYPEGVSQRERDVGRATELFAAAGVEEFTIRAADFFPGIVASAELFVQQLAECGVKGTVEVADPTTYFSDFAQVLSTPCQAFFFVNRPAVTLLSTYTGSAAPFNLFGSGDPDYDAALATALSTVDAAERDILVGSLLETVRDEEGWLIWGFVDQIDAQRDGLDGVDSTQGVPWFGRATLS